VSALKMRANRPIHSPTIQRVTDNSEVQTIPRFIRIHLPPTALRSLVHHHPPPPNSLQEPNIPHHQQSLCLPHNPACARNHLQLLTVPSETPRSPRISSDSQKPHFTPSKPQRCLPSVSPGHRGHPRSPNLPRLLPHPRHPPPQNSPP
jgi:hypothetical protein